MAPPARGQAPSAASRPRGRARPRGEAARRLRGARSASHRADPDRSEGNSRSGASPTTCPRRPAPRRFEDPPQLGDVEPELSTGLRWVPRPEHVEDPVRRHDFAGMLQEQREQRPLRRRADPRRDPVVDELDRAEHPEFQRLAQDVHLETTTRSAQSRAKWAQRPSEHATCRVGGRTAELEEVSPEGPSTADRGRRHDGPRPFRPRPARRLLQRLHRRQ